MNNKKCNLKVLWITSSIGFVISLLFFFIIYPIIARYLGWYWTEKPFLAKMLYDLLYIMGVKNSSNLVYAKYGLLKEFRNIPLPIYDIFLSILIFIIFIILGVVLSKTLPPPKPKEKKTKPQKVSVRPYLSKNTDTSEDINLF